MGRIAFVNGRYVPHTAAQVHVEDRGYQFADGVYEVCEVRDGALIDVTRHLDRLERSLDELRIDHPGERSALTLIMREVVRRNRIRNGMLYLQVTRGVAPRDHGFPANVRPSVVMTARAASRARADAQAAAGIAVITVPDNRWDRVDIKSTSLLPNVLAKQAAREAGAYEAWFVDGDGFVTEGSSTNAWIVTREGTLVTRAAEHGILRGITRGVVSDVAATRQIRVVERPFSVEEAKTAREAFITAATTIVMPVVSIDGHAVGDGKPGPVALGLRAAFHDGVERLSA